jgi:hypothetical protein
VTSKKLTLTKQHHNKKQTMKKLTTVFVATIFSLTVFGQTEKVQGNLSTADTADLTILNIYPDSFPNVSVVFKPKLRNRKLFC